MTSFFQHPIPPATAAADMSPSAAVPDEQYKRVKEILLSNYKLAKEEGKVELLFIIDAHGGVVKDKSKISLDKFQQLKGIMWLCPRGESAYFGCRKKICKMPGIEGKAHTPSDMIHPDRWVDEGVAAEVMGAWRPYMRNVHSIEREREICEYILSCHCPVIDQDGRVTYSHYSGKPNKVKCREALCDSAQCSLGLNNTCGGARGIYLCDAGTPGGRGEPLLIKSLKDLAEEMGGDGTHSYVYLSDVLTYIEKTLIPRFSVEWGMPLATWALYMLTCRTGAKNRDECGNISGTAGGGGVSSSSSGSSSGSSGNRAINFEQLMKESEDLLKSHRFSGGKKKKKKKKSIIKRNKKIRRRRRRTHKMKKRKKKRRKTRRRRNSRK